MYYMYIFFSMNLVFFIFELSASIRIVKLKNYKNLNYFVKILLFYNYKISQIVVTLKTNFYTKVMRKKSSHRPSLKRSSKYNAELEKEL